MVSRPRSEERGRHAGYCSWPGYSQLGRASPVTTSGPLPTTNVHLRPSTLSRAAIQQSADPSRASHRRRWTRPAAERFVESQVWWQGCWNSAMDGGLPDRQAETLALASLDRVGPATRPRARDRPGWSEANAAGRRHRFGHWRFWPGCDFHESLGGSSAGCRSGPERRQCLCWRPLTGGPTRRGRQRVCQGRWNISKRARG